MTKDEFKAYVASKIKSNGAGEITAEVLAEVLGKVTEIETDGVVRLTEEEAQCFLRIGTPLEINSSRLLEFQNAMCITDGRCLLVKNTDKDTYEKMESVFGEVRVVFGLVGRWLDGNPDECSLFVAYGYGDNKVAVYEV